MPHIQKARKEAEGIMHADDVDVNKEAQKKLPASFQSRCPLKTESDKQSARRD
jgi:hypothetical protein